MHYGQNALELEDQASRKTVERKIKPPGDGQAVCRLIAVDETATAPVMTAESADDGEQEQA